MSRPCEFKRAGPAALDPRRLRCIAAEGSVFARCVMLFCRPWTSLRTRIGVIYGSDKSGQNPALERIICLRNLSLLWSASETSWRECRCATPPPVPRSYRDDQSAGPSRERTAASCRSVQTRNPAGLFELVVRSYTRGAVLRRARGGPIGGKDPRCGIWPLAPRERWDLRPGAAPPLSRHTKPLRCRNRGRAEAKTDAIQSDPSAERCRLSL